MQVDSIPVLSADGTVYVGSNDFKLYAVITDSGCQGGDRYGNAEVAGFHQSRGTSRAGLGGLPSRELNLCRAPARPCGLVSRKSDHHQQRDRIANSQSLSCLAHGQAWLKSGVRAPFRELITKFFCGPRLLW